MPKNVDLRRHLPLLAGLIFLGLDSLISLVWFFVVGLALVRKAMMNPRVPREAMRHLQVAVKEQEAKEERFREQQLTMKSFFDSSPAMMGVVEIKDGEILPIFANDSGYRFMGQASERPAGAEAGPSERKAHLELVRVYERSRDTFTPVTVEIDRTIRGQKFWLNFTANYIGKSKSGADRYSYVAIDVSPQKIAEMEARAAMDAKARFLANMSHEIRTPINGVIGAVQLLQETHLNLDQKTYAEAIQNSANGLLTLVNDILDISKIDAGMLHFETIAFPLREVVLEAKKTIQYSLRDKPLSIQLDFGEALPKVLMGDPNRLRQVLLNLLSNAVKFTKKGKVDVRITPLIPRGKLQGIRFEVEDEGIGISMDAQKQLFQPFFQAESSTSRRFGGTGLGLSICKYLVENMNGTITAESTVGKGSTFRFDIYLPEGSLPVDGTLSPQSAVSRFHGKILIVEDNEINSMITQRSLRILGLETHTAADGMEALKALERDKFDLILMDCQMPVLDGYQTTQRLRADALNANTAVPVVALTANVFKEDIECCLKSGMSDYLAKPFKQADMVAILQRWLGEKHSARSLPISGLRYRA